MLLILVIILAILVFIIVGTKNTKDSHTIYFLVALSLFGVFIWTAPRLPQVLETESGPTKALHISLYVIFLVILVWYVIASIQRYFVPRFPFVDLNRG